MIVLYNLPKGVRFEQKLNIGKIEALLPSSQPRFGLFIGMIEIYKRNSHFSSDGFKVMMIKVTHFSAFILSLLPKIHFFRILKSPLEEQFLILIRSFFGFTSSILESLYGHPLLLIELLDLNIIELIIVQKFAE